MRPTIELVLDWPHHPVFQSKRLVDNLDSLEVSSRKVRASEGAVDTLAVVSVVGDVVLGVPSYHIATGLSVHLRKMSTPLPSVRMFTSVVLDWK